MGSYIWVPLRSFEVLQDQVRSYKGQLCWYILDLSIIVWCLVARDRIYGSWPKMYGDFHDNPLLWTMNTTYVSKVCKGFVILHISPSLVIDPAHPLANLRCPQPGVWPRLGINWSLMDGPPPPISLLCRLFWSHHLDKCFCCVLRCLMIVCLEMTRLDWDQLH